MKVLFINGSPHPQGCTWRGMVEIEKVLKENRIETEWLNVGTKDVRGCIGCNYCRAHNKCVFDDIVNESAHLLDEADAVIVGSPTYYAGPNGQLHSYLDRLFYSTAGYINKAMKLGATVIASRRAGSTSAFDDLNKYFTISSMPIVSSTYWNEVHGFSKEDVEQDLEGLQTMRNLANNLVFLLNAVKAQKEKTGIPVQESNYFTSFFQK